MEEGSASTFSRFNACARTPSIRWWRGWVDPQAWR